MTKHKNYVVLKNIIDLVNIYNWTTKFIQEY